MIFNLFHAATHFATQFNLTTPFRKLPVRHMKCSCVCTIENHNDYKKSTISLCWTKTHLLNSCTWQHQWERPVPYTNHSTPYTNHSNSLNTRIKTPLAAAIRYLIYKHITFLGHKLIRALPNATVFCIVMVIITLKTIFNKKVGYHFCQAILLFWLRQKVVP